MKSVGVIAKAESPLAAQCVKGLLSWLSDRNFKQLMDSNTAKIAGLNSNLTIHDVVGQSDIIVAMGGDGTIIGLSRMIENRAVPLLGVNLGSLGFLTEFSYEDMFEGLEKILNNDFAYEDRIMIDARLYNDSKEKVSYTALNDVVIHRGALAQMIDIVVEVDDVLVNTYTADGLIVSTPTGSTAYNLSNGGPIVYPSLNSFIISPICPHTLSIRPIVLPDSVTIHISISPRVKSEVVATVDGQIAFGLGVGGKLRIAKSSKVTRIIRSPFAN